VYIEQDNKGLGGARNTAIRHSTGDIIAILDQDDIWHANKLEKMAGIYKRDPSADVVCHYFYELEKGNKKLIKTGPFSEDMFKKLLFDGNCLGTLAATFKKSLIEKTGYFSENVEKMHFVEDYDMWLKMAYAGCKFVFLPEPLADYVIHGDNYSSGNIARFERICINEANVIKFHYGLLKPKNLTDIVRFSKRMSKLFLNLSVKYLLQGDSKEYKEAVKYLIMGICRYPLSIIEFPLELLVKRSKHFFVKRI
jgi:glycosyltransferase involved in cell wall biosynthesis